MKKSKVEALLPLIGSKVTGHRSMWVLGSCPYAPWRHETGDANPSFGIRADDTKKSIFKCFSCNMAGDLLHLQLTLNEYLHKDKLPQYKMGSALDLIGDEMADLEFDTNIPDYVETSPLVDFVFPEKWLASFKPVAVFPEAVAYLASRGIQKTLYRALDLRYDPFLKRVCFPYRNAKKELMGLQGRYAAKTIPKDTLRYYFYRHQGHLNQQCWMGEDHMNLDKPLVLVEGPMDYAKVFQVYPNVVAAFSSGISQDKFFRIADAAEIITFFDAGKGGDAAREATKKFFKHLKDVKHTPLLHLIPPNAETDPGAMSAAEVAHHLVEYVKLDFLPQP